MYLVEPGSTRIARGIGVLECFVAFVASVLGALPVVHGLGFRSKDHPAYP